jgi:hypothetical protein
MYLTHFGMTDYSARIQEKIHNSSQTPSLKIVPVRTVNRDLSLLMNKPLYLLNLSIYVGCSKLTLKFETLGVTQEVVDSLKNRNATPPSITVFPHLAAQANILRGRRKKLQQQHLIYWEPFWVCHEEKLPLVLQEIEQLESQIDELRAMVLDSYDASYKEYLESIIHLGRTANLSESEIDRVFERYAQKFPTRDYIARNFRLELWGPVFIPSLIQQADQDSQLNHALAERERSAAEIEQVRALTQLQRRWREGVEEGLQTTLHQAQQEIISVFADCLDTLESLEPGKVSHRAQQKLEVTIERIYTLASFSETSMEEFIHEISSLVKLSSLTPVESGNALASRLQGLRQKFTQEVVSVLDTPGHRNLADWLILD